MNRAHRATRLPPYSFTWTIATGWLLAAWMVVFGLYAGNRGLLVLGAEPGPGDAWPAWRGNGAGVADTSQVSLPVAWSETENVLWRTEVPGEGNSSPIVWGDRVYLTAWLDEGAKRLVLALDGASGKIVWRTELPRDEKTLFYAKTGFAAPTLATDGQRLYAFFDTPGLVALDMQGQVVWKRRLGPFDGPYNMASSPILYQDLVIQCCDQHGPSFVAAFERSTGKERWRTSRASSSCGHFGTPLVIRVGDRPQLVINGEPVVAYDPETGKELWSCHGMKECVAPSPVFGHGLVYASSGRTGPVMAIDPTGRGNVTDSHVRLHLTSGGPYVPTPLVYPHLMVPGDNGRMLFYNGSGKLALEDRIRDHFTSSPIGADGKIYWCSERGKTYVIDATRLADERPSCHVLAVNQLQGAFLATPAVAHSRLFLRSDQALYCIAQAGRGTLVKSKTTSGESSATFAELKARYEQHRAPWENEPEARIRLETLEAIARLDDPEVIPFLFHTAQKEPHWDICEEAAKSLGRKGPPAIDSLVILVPDSRPFIRTIAILELGRLKVEKAIPGLLVATHDKQPLVRCASLHSLGQIAQAGSPSFPKILTAIQTAATDRQREEAVVRQSALDGLAAMAGQVAEHRLDVLETLASVAADPNPRLAAKAKGLLDNPYRATPAEMEKVRGNKSKKRQPS